MRMIKLYLSRIYKEGVLSIYLIKFGAGTKSRTRGLLITNHIAMHDIRRTASTDSVKLGLKIKDISMMLNRFYDGGHEANPQPIESIKNLTEKRASIGLFSSFVFL